MAESATAAGAATPQTEDSPRNEKKDFKIRGGNRLVGTYAVQGNKNAALPLIAAALLSRSPVVLKRVPHIRDVRNLLQLLQTLRVGIDWDERGLTIDPSTLDDSASLPDEAVRRLRGGILLLAPLATRRDHIECALPGGCSIGRRSFEAHWSVFRAAGFEIEEHHGHVELRRVDRTSHPHIFLREASVTATENALILFAAVGRGRIENPAREPHVFSLIEFLRMLGCRIESGPLSFEVVEGVSHDSQSVEFEVPADYIDAGTLSIAAAATGGEVVLEGVGKREMVGIRPYLEDFGVRFEDLTPESVRVSAGERRNPPQLKAGLWPLFPTDLTSLAIVLAVQGQGLCLIHDWMYEARMFFVDKLVRMGARITLCDPHRVLVEGSGRLKGVPLESPDIRAGMALVVAGLCAEGTTLIEHAEVIERGYERVSERLRAIGADIVEGR